MPGSQGRSARIPVETGSGRLAEDGAGIQQTFQAVPDNADDDSAGEPAERELHTSKRIRLMSDLISDYYSLK
nr:hypothetical protein [uncultured Hyphomonas sp.]